MERHKIILINLLESFLIDYIMQILNNSANFVIKLIA